MKIVLLLFTVAVIASAQRITTIQLDGVQYFVSRMNPYSPELNYFLAYQYCRSLGLQLASFETKEKADTMTQYLKNAGYDKFDFWTSGNKLGTDMHLWMSTGQPFNASFDNMVRRPVNRLSDVPPGTEPQRVARESGDSGSANSCVAMVKPTLGWDTQDCSMIKDFICEQTRCYYYNYGSIPVSATQGSRKPDPTTTTTTTPQNDDDQQHYDTAADNSEADSTNTEGEEEEEQAPEHEETPPDHEDLPSTPEDPVVGRLMGSLAADPLKHTPDSIKVEKSRTEDIPDITSLFTSGLKRPEAVFEGLQTHEIRSLQRQQNYDKAKPMPDNALEESKTIGPYDSLHDYVNDEPASGVVGETSKDQEEDSSTPYPDAEPAYRYNIKVRSNGKVLDPPSK